MTGNTSLAYFTQLRRLAFMVDILWSGYKEFKGFLSGSLFKFLNLSLHCGKKKQDQSEFNFII